MALWAARYEDEFFHDRPETNIDIESEEEVDDIEDITPDDAQIDINPEDDGEDLSIDSLLD